MSMRDKVISGAYWSYMSLIVRTTTTFVVQVVLARLLMPADFGVVGMVAAITGFTQLLVDFGFSYALVQRKNLTSAQIHTVFWLNLGVSAFFGSIIALSAPLIGDFYNEPRVINIARVLGIFFVTEALSATPGALMRREMKFKELFYIGEAAQFSSAIVAVIIGYLGGGPWALIAMSLMRSTVTAAYLLRVGPHRPAFVFDFASVREIIGYGANLTANNFIAYWARNLDQVLIGKYIGSSQLGIYSRAYSLMMLPLTYIMSGIGRVMGPAISALQDDLPQARKLFLRTLVILAFVSFPITGGMVVVADAFIRTLLGERWMSVVPVLRTLAICGALQLMSNPTNWIYTSLGRTDLQLRRGIFMSTATISAVVLGVWLGTIESVALCYTAAQLVIFYPVMADACRLIGLKFSDLARAIAGISLATIVMMLLVTGAALIVPAAWHHALRLVVLVTLGVLTYVALVIAMRLSVVQDVLSVMPARLRPAFLVRRT